MIAHLVEMFSAIEEHFFELCIDTGQQVLQIWAPSARRAARFLHL